MDISIIGKQWREDQFKEALAVGNMPAIVKYLRELKEPLPVEFAHMLAAILDPDRKPLKNGPKQSKEKDHARERRNNFAIGLHMHLAKDREFARFMLNMDKECFEINDSENESDADGNFSPDWKYPKAERKRKAVNYPNRQEIEAYVCKVYGFGKTTYERIIAEHRKKAAQEYFDLLEKGYPAETAKQVVCRWYILSSAELDEKLRAHGGQKN